MWTDATAPELELEVTNLYFKREGNNVHVVQVELQGPLLAGMNFVNHTKQCSIVVGSDE